MVLGEVDLFSVQNRSKIRQNKEDLTGNAPSKVNYTFGIKSSYSQGGSTSKEYKICYPACAGDLALEEWL